jgi:hypothetical protein
MALYRFLKPSPHPSSRPGMVTWIINMLLLAGLVCLYLVGFGQLAGSTWSDRLFTVVLYASFASTGALISIRKPGNPIGWIFSGVVFLFLVTAYAVDYAQFGLVQQPGSLPGAIWAAWLSHWLGTVPFAAMLTFTFLLFPDGYFFSPGWRWVAWFIILMTSVQVIAQMLNPGPMSSFNNFNNPLGIQQAAVPLHWLVAVLPTLGGVAILASALSLLVRYRRSQGSQRLQIQWIALGTALPIVTLFLVTLFSPNIGESSSLFDQVFNLLFLFSVLSFPVTTTIAILRYRLYDIEVILQRTLVYTTLTGLLALVYFGSVVLLQRVSRLFMDSESPLAVVISTLAIAALFTPLRRRVQALIDRRFYRRRYDTNQVLQSFSIHLREEVDLEQLNQRLLATVEEAIQPEGVSIWMKN